MTPNNSEGPKSRTEIRAAYQYLDPLCLCVCVFPEFTGGEWSS